MAGLGTRFSDAGYKDPKPLIDVNGKPMIKAVIDSLNIDGNYIFIVQKEHSIKYNLPKMLNEIVPGCQVVELDTITDGAARTTLMAKELINNDIPLLIANSDQIVAWQGSVFSYVIESFDTIALFYGNDPKWSYAKIDGGFVTEVAEKIVISDTASVGIYGWSKGSDYVKYAEQMIEKNIKTNNEFYIAPVYNEAIADGKKVLPFFVEKMSGIGTPEDLSIFLKENK